MSKMKLSLVASALFGAVAFAGSTHAADPLEQIHKAERAIHKAAANSQVKIDSIHEQTQEIVLEYRDVVAETEIHKVYNDHVAKLVAEQNKEIASLEGQIAEVENTKRNVVPLMYRMIDMLEKFVKADIPIKSEVRADRIERLRRTMTDPNVSTSERYRQVLEAYEIEANYGTVFDAYQGELDLGDRKITADFVHMGRIALLAQSLDLKNAWVWNNSTRTWDELGAEYLKPVTTAIRMARKQLSPDLAKLPVFAAGAQ